MNNKRTKLILLIISVLLVIFNFIQTILCVGVAGDLLTFSLTFSFLAFLYFKNKLKYADKYRLDITLIVCTLIVCTMTIIYSPRYYYKQAQKIIISEEYINKDVSLLDLNVKTIPVKENINFLIDKGYVIGLEEADNNEVYYFFNPVTGEYTKIDSWQ